MSPGVVRVPVLPAGGCPAACRPEALVEEGRLLGFVAEPVGGPCPWCLAVWREEGRADRPARPLLPRAGRRLAGGGHEMEQGRPGEAIDRLAGFLDGRAERVLWIEPETMPLERVTLPHRVARLGVPVHLVRVPHAPWHVARRLARMVPRERLVSLAEADPGPGDLVLAWDVDPAGGWGSAATWLAAARARGARIVSVGPLAGADGLGADLALRVPPGWEGALALALAVTSREPAPGGWSLRRVAEKTGIDGATLGRVADLLSAADRGRYLLPGAPLAAESETTVAALAHLALVRDARLAVAMPPPAPGPLLPGEGRVLAVRPAALVDLLGELPAGKTLVVAAGIDPLAGAPGAGPLGAFLDAAGLVAVFGPWDGAAARRADLVVPLPGPLARAGTAWAGTGPWCGRSLVPARGEIGDELAIWRAVGRRLGGPGGLFDAPDPDCDHGAEGLPPALPAPSREPGALAGEWRPDPSLVTGEGGLIFLARRVPPGDEQEGLPVVRVAPATAAERNLHEDAPARAQTGEGGVPVRVVLDGRLPAGIAVYAAPDTPSRAGPGVLAPPPLVLGAAAPFRGELFPPPEGRRS